MTAPIALSQWDTDFFGLRIACVDSDRLTPETADAIDAWCADNQIELCVMLADPDDVRTAHLAAQHGYAMIDFRVTLDIDLTNTPIRPPRRNARHFHPDDLDELARIARESFTDSRFIYDARFPVRHRVGAMYEAWLRRRCGDENSSSTYPPADMVVVADADDGLPAGFVTCILRPPDAEGQRTGVVDLVAVDSRARGQYIGESMVNAALLWFADHECRTVEVVTQGRNVAAQRLYQRCGFAIAHAQTWYHKWMSYQ